MTELTGEILTGGTPELIEPFSLETANQAQTALARECGISRPWTNSISMEFVPIPAGKFTRGYNPENQRILKELPRDVHNYHPTIISLPLLVGVHRITQAQHLAITGKSPSYYSSTGRLSSRVVGVDTSRFPVDSVSWLDCIEACNELGKLEGFAPYYRFNGDVARLNSGTIIEGDVTILGGGGYRLLTSAEWEYCCRAGTTTLYYFGNVLDGPRREACSVPNPVGTDGPNHFGLYDLLAHLEEWVFDAMNYNSYGRYVGKVATDPVDLESDDLERVTRGLNSALRGFQPAGDSAENIGYRVCRTIEIS